MTLVDKPEPGTGTFEFDMATPFFKQVQVAFDALTTAPLTDERVSKLKRSPGVYGLSLERDWVYIGKADKDVASRLRKHRRAVDGRLHLNPTDLSFRVLYLAHTWDPFQPEKELIRHYGTDRAPGWNEKGFGTNDPGRNRDMTELGDDHWHVRFPIDPDYVPSAIEPGTYGALQLLETLRKVTPYWVRYQGRVRGRTAESKRAYGIAQKDYKATQVEVPAGNMSTKDLLLAVAQALPDPKQWQITHLPSHLLLYKEQEDRYPRMIKLWP